MQKNRKAKVGKQSEKHGHNKRAKRSGGYIYIYINISTYDGFHCVGAFGAFGARGFCVCIIETAGFVSNMVCFANANGIQLVSYKLLISKRAFE